MEITKEMLVALGIDKAVADVTVQEVQTAIEKMKLGNDAYEGSITELRNQVKADIAIALTAKKDVPIDAAAVDKVDIASLRIFAKQCRLIAHGEIPKGGQSSDPANIANDDGETVPEHCSEALLEKVEHL